jgi:serine/threonine protein kinase/WD40 repeat protein
MTGDRKVDTHDTDPQLRAVDADGTSHGEDAVRTREAQVVTSIQQIGPYVLVRTVGRGGMGVVYLALDKNGKEVALKVIPAGADADPTDLARFRTEAAAVASLDHPNIVKLYEVGEADGVAYLAMEYIDGGTLYKQIKGGVPIDPAEAARLVEQISRAIHYAHTHGVLHRDLKPSNILMAKGGVPKLADFGLAKQLDQSLRLTRTGIAVGTPHYMAPEQARGEASVGPTLDIHGLGAILYELLTGLPPFMGRNPADTMQQVVHKKPTPPSALRNDVPHMLEAICLRCLEKDPRKRYQTAQVLADDLHRFLATPNETTRLSPVMTDPPSRKWFALTVAIAAVLLVVSVLSTWFITSRAHRGEQQSLRVQSETASKTERRARMEAAIAMCERGQVALGLDQIRTLSGDPDLPVPEIIAAWEGRLLKQVVPASEPPDLSGLSSAQSTALKTGDRAEVEPTGRVRIQAAGDSQWHPLPPDSDASAVAFAADGNVLAVGAKNGSVRVWDAIARVPMTDVFVAGKVAIDSIQVIARATDYLVLARLADASVVYLSCGRPFVAAPIRLPDQPGEEVLGVTFSTEGSQLFVTSPSGMTLFRLQGDSYEKAHGYSTRDRYSKWLGRGRFMSSAIRRASDADAEAMVIGGSHGRLFVVDAKADKDMFAGNLPGGSDVKAVAVSSKGHVCVATPAERGTRIRHWSKGLDGEAGSESMIESPVRREAFLPDGAGLVFGCENGKVHFWDPAAGKEMREPIDLGSPVLDVAVSGDGKCILAGCEDGTAQLWDRESGTKLMTVRHRAEVRAVDFHGNDPVTASADGTARRWHAATGLPLGPPMAHPDAISALSVWRGLVATGGRSGYVRVWRLK